MTGGRIVGAVVLGVTRHSVLVQELHSTKGWKPVHLTRRNHFGGNPVVRAFHKRPPREASAQYDTLIAESGRMMRGRRIPDMGEPPRSALMAHGWYRRKMMAPKEEADGEV